MNGWERQVHVSMGHFEFLHCSKFAQRILQGLSMAYWNTVSLYSLSHGRAKRLIKLGMLPRVASQTPSPSPGRAPAGPCSLCCSRHAYGAPLHVPSILVSDWRGPAREQWFFQLTEAFTSIKYVFVDETVEYGWISIHSAKSIYFHPNISTLSSKTSDTLQSNGRFWWFFLKKIH